MKLEITLKNDYGISLEGVDVNLTDADLAQDRQELWRRFLDPAFAVLIKAHQAYKAEKAA